MVCNETRYLQLTSCCELNHFKSIHLTRMSNNCYGNDSLDGEFNKVIIRIWEGKKVQQKLDAVVRNINIYETISQELSNIMIDYDKSVEYLFQILHCNIGKLEIHPEVAE